MEIQWREFWDFKEVDEKKWDILTVFQGVKIKSKFKFPKTQRIVLGTSLFPLGYTNKFLKLLISMSWHAGEANRSERKLLLTLDRLESHIS